MERNIDSMGRVVIPSEFRKQLKISDGDLINMEIEHNNSIVITKVNSKPSDIRREMIVTDATLAQGAEVAKRYQEGTPIECIETVGESGSYNIPRGTHGVISFVDKIGTIFVSWENGIMTGIREDKDRFKIIK